MDLPERCLHCALTVNATNPYRLALLLRAAWQQLQLAAAMEATVELPASAAAAAPSPPPLEAPAPPSRSYDPTAQAPARLPSSLAVALGNIPWLPCTRPDAQPHTSAATTRQPQGNTEVLLRPVDLWMPVQQVQGLLCDYVPYVDLPGLTAHPGKLAPGPQDLAAWSGLLGALGVRSSVGPLDVLRLLMGWSGACGAGVATSQPGAGAAGAGAGVGGKKRKKGGAAVHASGDPSGAPGAGTGVFASSLDHMAALYAALDDGLRAEEQQEEGQGQGRPQRPGEEQQTPGAGGPSPGGASGANPSRAGSSTREASILHAFARHPLIWIPDCDAAGAGTAAGSSGGPGHGRQGGRFYSCDEVVCSDPAGVVEELAPVLQGPRLRVLPPPYLGATPGHSGLATGGGASTGGGGAGTAWRVLVAGCAAFFQRLAACLHPAADAIIPTVGARALSVRQSATVTEQSSAQPTRPSPTTTSPAARTAAAVAPGPVAGAPRRAPLFVTGRPAAAGVASPPVPPAAARHGVGASGARKLSPPGVADENAIDLDLSDDDSEGIRDGDDSRKGGAVIGHVAGTPRIAHQVVQPQQRYLLQAEPSTEQYLQCLRAAASVSARHASSSVGLGSSPELAQQLLAAASQGLRILAHWGARHGEGRLGDEDIALLRSALQVELLLPCASGRWCALGVGKSGGRTVVLNDDPAVAAVVAAAAGLELLLVAPAAVAGVQQGGAARAAGPPGGGLGAGAGVGGAAEESPAWRLLEALGAASLSSLVTFRWECRGVQAPRGRPLITHRV